MPRHFLKVLDFTVSIHISIGTNFFLQAILGALLLNEAVFM